MPRERSAEPGPSCDCDSDARRDAVPDGHLVCRIRLLFKQTVEGRTVGDAWQSPVPLPSSPFRGVSCWPGRHVTPPERTDTAQRWRLPKAEVSRQARRMVLILQKLLA